MKCELGCVVFMCSQSDTVVTVKQVKLQVHFQTDCSQTGFADKKPSLYRKNRNISKYECFACLHGALIDEVIKSRT